jgi:hypothetical protein
MVLGTLGLSINKKLEEFSKRYAKDPLESDTVLNNLVIGQTGKYPDIPLSYYQRCGSAFYWPQTCEHKERIQRDTIAKLDEYYAKYQLIRKDLIKVVTDNLKNDPERDRLLADFQYGEKILQAELKKQMNKIQSLQKFENIAWSAFTLVSTALAAQTGIKYVVSAVSFANTALRDISEQVELDVKSLHRFSEEPPNFSTKALSTKSLQWDHTRYIITLLVLIEEYQTIYFNVFPELKKDRELVAGSSQTNNILFLLAGVLLLYKINS